MLLCDIETPEELKLKFEEFCPMFKNTMVSRDDIGEHMREYAERNNVFKKPRRMLIGSYFGEKSLLITLLVKWYLDHGLKVTKVYEFIVYYPSKCFGTPQPSTISDSLEHEVAGINKTSK